MSRAFLLLPLLALTACHAKFKKHVHEVDAVKTQVVLVGGPYVDLGEVYASGQSPLAQVAAAAVNVTQAVREVNQVERIGTAVQVADMSASLDQGIADTLRDGPPFAYSSDAGTGSLLQLEVLSYGLQVPYIGAQGTFTMTARARIYKPDGDRIYRKSMTCETSFGNAAAAAQVLGTVNNVKQLNEMTDAEINDTFAAMAHYCGTLFVTKIRKHAS